MNKKLKSLHLKIAQLESEGFINEANMLHEAFIKMANDENLENDQDLDEDDELDDDDYDYDSEEHRARFIHPTRIFFNSQTNLPIIYEGKMLATFSSEDDYPELRGKVKAMTGIENITIVRIPADVRNIISIQTEADERRMDKIHEGHVNNIEYYPDIIYLLLVGENTLNVDGKDIIFASREDAESFANILRIYFESINQDVDIAPAALSVSLADSPEEGMSLPELLGDEEFIFFENSEIGVWDRPETIGDLEHLMSWGNLSKKMTVERLQELHSGKEEWELDDIFGDHDDEDGNGNRFSSVLKKLHILASKLEDIHMYEESVALNNIFMRVAKSKKKKNVPNDPALYSRCKSEVKKKFKVWPSAYGSAALVKLYKSRGGTYRS